LGSTPYLAIKKVIKMNKETYEKMVDWVTNKLKNDELTGRCFNDGCTDGYDTHYVLLAQQIINMVNPK